jgi:hypothetical protein
MPLSQDLVRLVIEWQGIMGTDIQIAKEIPVAAHDKHAEGAATTPDDEFTRAMFGDFIGPAKHMP